MQLFRAIWLGSNIVGKNSEPLTFNSSSSVFELLGLIVLFVLLIIACYYVTRFVGTKQMKQLKNSNFSLIDTYRITQNKFLQLVKIGNRYIVIAVTKDHISVITELSEEEVLVQERNIGQKSFKNVLSDFINKKKVDEKVDKS